MSRVQLTVIAIFWIASIQLYSQGKALSVEMAGKTVPTPSSQVESEISEKVGEKKSPDFQDLLVLFKHPEVLKGEREVRRWEREKKLSLSSWFPSFSASFQWEDAKKMGHPTLGRQDQSRSISRASVDQLLFDFGEGYFDYQAAVEEWKGVRVKLYETSDRVLYEGLSSALREHLLEKLLDQAIASEKNFLKQKELEQQKVDGGQGFSTDVLQVEVQYLGAVAKVRQAKLDHESAREAVERWWGRAGYRSDNSLLDRLETLISQSPIPKGEGLIPWMSTAPSLVKNSHDQRVMLLNKKSLMGGIWGPTVSLRLLTQHGEELGGVNSYDREDRVSIQAELPLNLGGTSIDEVASLGLQMEMLAEEGFALEKELVEDLRVAQMTFEAQEDLVETRKKQMAVSEEYLLKAEKERLMGRRSLIDVLNGELLRLQAESEVERARIDRVIAWCRFYQLSGRLGQTLGLQ